MIFKIRKSGWALLFSFTSLFILGLSDNIRGVLFPEILSFYNLTSSVGSFSFGIASAASFAGSSISHYYLKKHTLPSLLVLSVLSLCVGLLVMGVSPNYPVYLVGCVFLGLSIGMMAIVQNLLVAENVSEVYMSRAMAGLQTMYALSSFIAPLLAAEATLRYGSWRAAFMIVAALSFLFLIVQFLILPNEKFTNEHILQLQNEAEVRIPFKNLMIVGCIFVPYILAEIMIGTRLAQYMRNYSNMNLENSSLYVTYFFLGMLLGRAVLTFVKLPFSLRLQMNISLVGAVLFLVLGLIYNPVFLPLVGLMMGPYYPLCMTYISELSGVHSRRFMTFTFGLQGLAIVGMHIGVGYMTDQVGLFYAFGVGIFALFFSLICLNLHPKKLYFSI